MVRLQNWLQKGLSLTDYRGFRSGGQKCGVVIVLDIREASGQGSGQGSGPGSGPGPGPATDHEPHDRGARFPRLVVSLAGVD